MPGKRLKREVESQTTVLKSVSEESEISSVEDEEEFVDAQSHDSDGDDDEHDVDLFEDAVESTSTDPFYLHFAEVSEPVLKKAIQKLDAKGWTSSKALIETLSDLKYTVTTSTVNSSSISGVSGSLNATSLDELHIKSRLHAPFRELNKKVAKDHDFSELQTKLVNNVSDYKDVIFAPRNLHNARAIQNVYALHALNHIFKTRDNVLKDNARLAKADQEKLDPPELRDQGFTRPKVLVVLPTRDACYRFVETIIKLSGSNQQENLKRFKTDYFDDSQLPAGKPEDFRQFFQGNNDDNFRIGIKFTRKTIKLYTEFYNSDLIIASPLGLRLSIGDVTDKKRDFDFLSSIEIVILDQADALLMQNWEHVLHIFKHLNLIPKDPHGCDFSRIRNWYLDGQANYLRQTLILSQFVTPEINALLTQHCHNVSGKIKYRPYYSGILGDIGGKISHAFVKVYSTSPQEDPDKKFKYFISKALPSIVRTASASQGGTVIFVASYGDYVRIRNYLEQERQIEKKLGSSESNSLAISEYTSVPDVTRARTLFKDGKSKILLYSERLHHFRRYEIKGAANIFFYGLPANPAFYIELSRFLLRSTADGRAQKGSVSVKSLFSKWDALKLERVVGSAKVGKMCNGQGEIFEFS
ncbi:hypothetical protein V1514DRAFT_326883 [Lipomyces japonicus]|uniref:uncharacterized protein n=1 Tax=Lipomyces japonicus TaxID=56871 RepID=UPI0034CEDCA9